MTVVLDPFILVGLMLLLNVLSIRYFLRNK
jgi:hypothetical protein